MDALELLPDFTDLIAQELKIRPRQVKAVADLLQQDATVPFIARYRKEATGSLDEVAITAIRQRLIDLAQLHQRKTAILASLSQRGLLTDQLKQQIEKAPTMAELEDIYLPYRPKRRTRATMAREKGLAPLAEQLLLQEPRSDPALLAAAFINPEMAVEDTQAALAGARDIIAEIVSEDKTARQQMRHFYTNTAQYVCSVVKNKQAEAFKYENYFDWKEPVFKTPSHRVLAMRRGESEGFLTLRVMVDKTEALNILYQLFIKNDSPCAQQVKLAVADGFERLLAPSMETEIRLESKKLADQQAIAVFSENLRQLLMAPPLGHKRILAIDPGFRTGCKIVWLNEQGRLLGHDVIYPHNGPDQAAQAAQKILDICKTADIQAIAIGNGTAGRETETFIRSLPLPRHVIVLMVNESGASIYSASESARQEFPEYDLTVRGAVSIGRRALDPLAELVKIDPKSIGVGQYQHDVDQTKLKAALDDVVISCVNQVGVDVNTASKELLMYVSGLGPQLAQKIVDYRNENGAFANRQDLLKVPRLSAKAFEQAAGFLRIPNAANPLDASAVHPESYPIVEKMAADLNCSVRDLIQNPKLRKKINLNRYLTDTVGLPTLTDILVELEKPGRDPRSQFEEFQFASDVHTIEDLKPDMVLPGIVTNITVFGVFVDIGVHQDGLVHISQLSDRFVKDPAEIVKVHQKVQVRVLEVDAGKKRIKLSMILVPKPNKKHPPQDKKPPKTK